MKWPKTAFWAMPVSTSRRLESLSVARFSPFSPGSAENSPLFAPLLPPVGRWPYALHAQNRSQQKIEESAGVDRRNPLAMDTLFLLTLGSALLSSMRLHVDQLGAMQNGRFDAAGVRPEQVARWMKRAWAAVHWARLLIETPKGHYLPLLPIDVGGDLPEGWLRTLRVSRPRS